MDDPTGRLKLGDGLSVKSLKLYTVSEGTDTEFYLFLKNDKTSL